MSGIPFYIIDAFASEAFEGNPAAVCILPKNHGRSDEWMQTVASEINLSETAFVVPETHSLRWFTPGAEVDLCGHATVATAAALHNEGLAAVGELLQFHTRSGLLTAELISDQLVALDFPATPPMEFVPDSETESLFEGVVFWGESRFDLMVELANEHAVRAYTPDFGKLGRMRYRGVIVTARSEKNEVDFVSRFFAPAVGVDEDPVTGSAHCCLTPYWAKNLNKNKMSARQLSQRGGNLSVELIGERVKLTGGAVKVVKGTLF